MLIEPVASVAEARRAKELNKGKGIHYTAKTVDI